MEKKQGELAAYLKAVRNNHVALLVIVLDIVGIIAFAFIYIRDWPTAIAILVFALLMLVGNYKIFKDERDENHRLQGLVADAAPEIVPMPIETPSSQPGSREPLVLRIRNEGKSAARNIGLSMNYKDLRFFSARKGSLVPEESASLELKSELIDSPDSRVRVCRMESSDELILLRCEFFDPDGQKYIRRWECLWGGEWKSKKAPL